jgi:hypothetical protein
MPIEILSSNIIKIMLTFWSSTLRFMPPQFSERVGKWTHESRSNLHHKKHLSDTFICIFIFSTKLFWKYRNIFTSFHTQPKPKNIITTVYLLSCIVIYFTVLHIILLLLTFTPCAWQPLDGVGNTRTRNCLQVARIRMTRAFSTVPWEFDINPEFPSWGKFTLATTLCTWSPNLAHLLSVITY